MVSLSGLPAVREHWAAPGEPILWMLTHRRVTYDMKGRRPDGRPVDGLGKKMLKGAGIAALAVATAFEDGDTGGDGPSPPPSIIAHGEGPRCAAAALADVPSGFIDKGFWVLTPGRMAFLAPPVAPQQRKSLLKQVTDFAQDVAAVFKPEAPYEPGRPIPTQPLVPVFETAWRDGGEIVRKMKRRTEKEPVYRRFVLPDGSGFDFHREPKKSVLPQHLTSTLHRIA